MEKKQYQHPTMEVYSITRPQLLSGSTTSEGETTSAGVHDDEGYNPGTAL